MNQKGNTTAAVLLIVGGIVLVLIGILVVAGLTQVDAGEIGVVTRWGKVTGRVLDPGMHYLMPIAERVLKYDTKKVIYETRSDAKTYDETYDEESGVYLDQPVDTNTKDGQQVNIYFTVRFSVDPTKAVWVAQNIGSEDALVGKVVKTESRIWARNIPREFEASQLYSGSTQQVQLQIADKLKPVFEANGLILDEVGVREIQFAKQYIDAIEAKQIAAVQVETERNKAEQAKFKKDAAITEAEAQSEAQRLQQQTLTPLIIEKMKWERWDGKFPQFLVSGDESQFILPLPSAQQ